MIGQSIAHYNITEKIGEGGMGEVYRATDTKLKRDVALKMLCGERRGDAEARRRFAREALTAAALDHPYICKIYEVVEDASGDVIVMEFVEGVSLGDSLKKKTPSIRGALRIAIEIAEALEAAHEKGIIHRDLKPSNIMITRRGHVKVMDFGLAKTIALPDIGSDSETTLSQLSGHTLVGTFGYMSPEQARGLDLGPSSDLFSLGVVLFEMLTGQAPFTGATVADNLQALLSGKSVPARELNPQIPAELSRVLERLLAVDPSQRYHASRNLLLDLNTSVRQTFAQASRTPSRQPQSKLCICGRSSRYPYCDNSHVNEGWSCAESPLAASVGFCASNRFLNLAQKLASHYGGTICLASDAAVSLQRLVIIIDGTDLGSSAQLYSQIDAKERIVFTLGVAGNLLSRLFPGSRLVDLSGTRPALAFQAITDVLDDDMASDASQAEPPILRSAFLSHAVSDEAVLLPVKEYLEEFFAADLFACADSIAPGSSWHNAIIGALEAKDIFVQLVSQASLDSQFCSFEAGMACALGKPIRTISLDGSRPPQFLQHLQVVDLKRLQQQKPWLDSSDLLVEALLKILL